MRSFRLVLLSVVALLLVLGGPRRLTAQGKVTADKAAVRAVLSTQAEDWNRGDLEAFAKGYKDSPDTLFIGKTVRHGYAEMLTTYRKGYPTREAMGRLTFANVEVHLLDARFAAVTGNFHLERRPAGGGNADGIYSLVLEKTAAGWKIVLDHTSSTGPA